MSKVLITGHTGFVGKNLVEALLLRKDDLVLYSRGDDLSKIVETRPEIIIHLASELKDEKKMYEANVELTEKIIDSSLRVVYKSFIALGSSSEYGLRNKPMKEGEVYSQEKTLYGRTKQIATSSCQSWAFLSGKNIMVLRPFSIYGKYDKENRFIPRLIKACLNEEEFDLWEGNHDWVNVEDVVQAILYFSQKELPGEVINIGTGIQTSNEEVAKIVEMICKKKVKIRNRYPSKPEESPVWVADTTKARSLGWEAKINLEEGIRREIERFKKAR